MRKAPKQARSRETVDAIVEAATRILCLRGWTRFTTNEVAEVAGVSVGSLYQYFPNKAALVAAIRRRHNQEVLAALTAAGTAKRAKSIADHAAQLVRGIVLAHEVDPKLHSVLDQVPHDATAIPRDAFYDTLMIQLTELVSGDSEGSQSASSTVAAHVLWGAMEGVMHVGSRYGQLAEPGFELELYALVEAYLITRSRRQPLGAVTSMLVVADARGAPSASKRPQSNR